MLGRLAKWLRLLGYDTSYENEIDDRELLRRAGSEGRILLTRDHGVMRRRQIGRGMVQAYLVPGDRVADQLADVRSRFGLEPRSEARCPEDNSPLDSFSREDARERVPAYVHETQSDFRICRVCGRIYWKATHWEKIQRVRDGLLQDPHHHP